LSKVTAEFEKLYPDTHIEFTEAPVGQREYLITQLAAEQAPERQLPSGVRLVHCRS
jgi:ABC-type glycerol-3-phosphate transport system substrate-binding protein